MSDSSDTGETPKCGFCFKTLHANVTKSLNKFEMKCSICFLTSQLHDGCAKKLYNANCTVEQRLKKNDDLSVNFFKSTSLTFHCRICKESCFYCGNDHQCRYIIITQLTYFDEYNLI